MLGLVLCLLAIGVTAGALAPLLVPGRQNMPIVVTIVLGLLGSLGGGFVGYVLYGRDDGPSFLQPAGAIGSIIGASVVLLLFIAFGRRRPAAVPSSPPARPAVPPHGGGAEPTPAGGTRIPADPQPRVRSPRTTREPR